MGVGMVGNSDWRDVGYGIIGNRVRETESLVILHDKCAFAGRRWCSKSAMRDCNLLKTPYHLTRLLKLVLRPRCTAWLGQVKPARLSIGGLKMQCYVVN